MDSDLDYVVKLKPLRVCAANEQFPETTKLTDKFNKQINWESGDVVALNGKSAEFADIFFVRETDGTDKSFFVMGQSKWDYGSKTMTENNVSKEEIKNNFGFYSTPDLYENYKPMTIIFTTQPYSGARESTVLTISKDGFNKQFGPVFLSRAVFNFTKNINPNFWDKNRLLNSLESIGKAKIDEVFSKRPFINEEDFYHKIPDAKSQQLDFFPYDTPGTEPYVL